MKSGVGDDPFADEDESDPVDEAKPEPVAEPEKTESIDSGKSMPSDTKQSVPSSTSKKTDTSREQSDTSSLDHVDVVGSVPHEDERIPFIMSRQSVKGSRDGKILQIALNQQTQSYLEEAVRQIQREYDDDVRKMDITEAVLLAGLMNLGDADSVLRTWGYDFQR